MGLSDNANGGVNIELWTQEAIEALSTTRISAETAARPVRGTSVALEIPLDTESRSPVNADDRDGTAEATKRPTTYSARVPSRRDSLKRREALLKGKEGSRRRQRWENDRLIGNPWATEPMPHDWEVHPTYPVHSVPYFLAPLWDERKAQAKMRAVEHAREESRRLEQEQRGKVPKELRAKLKRSKGARGLLQDLEEQVRDFVKMWEEKQRELQEQGLADAHSSDDEEIVFVGRNGHMKDMRPSRTSKTSLERDKMVFDSLVDDHRASFGRWLVHSIATYYNLRTWSRTTGNPARREAYVGIAERSPPALLERPLWVMV